MGYTHGVVHTETEECGLAGVLRGMRGCSVAGQQVRAALLHGLAHGATGPGSAPAAAAALELAASTGILAAQHHRHQAAAHPTPVRLLQNIHIPVIITATRTPMLITITTKLMRNNDVASCNTHTHTLVLIIVTTTGIITAITTELIILFYSGLL